MWWPVWIVLTLCILCIALYFGKDRHAYGAGIVLAGLIASQAAQFSPFPWLVLMAVWTCAMVALFNHKLYAMAVFAGLSACSYFPLWTSFLMADIFGVLMLLSAAGGMYDFSGLVNRGTSFGHLRGGHFGGNSQMASQERQAETHKP